MEKDDVKEEGNSSGTLTLEKIADNQGRMNGVEEMLKKNATSCGKFVSFVEFVSRHSGVSIEYLFSEMAGYLKHSSHVYRDFVNNFKSSVLFYEELNRFLQERIDNFKRFATYFNTGAHRITVGSDLDALNVLKLAVRLKDDSTYEHMNDTAEYTGKLGKHFNLSQRNLIILKGVGVDHDDGKIVTPRFILTKSGGLTPSEKVVMDKHAKQGKDVLGRLLPKMDGLDEFLSLIGSHHERSEDCNFDLMQGITSAADVFAALSRRRCYRDAYDPTKTREIMEGDVKSGKLHPTVIDAIFKQRVLVHPQDSARYN